jgi:hypothetical protein
MIVARVRYSWEQLLFLVVVFLVGALEVIKEIL